MKYLVLKFENARYFRTHNDTKDFVFLTHRTKVPRKDVEHFVVEGVTIYQVSNVLHVLFRERPIPSFRKVGYNRVERLYEMAAKSYLKYDNTIPIYEAIQIKKAVSDSYNPIAYFSWERIKRLCENKFEDVIKIFTKYSGIENPLLYRYNELVEIVKRTITDKEGFKSELKNIAVTPIYDSIFGTGNEISTINKNKRTPLTVNSGVEYAKVFGGMIYVPVTDDDISFLRKYSKGACNILDGGLVKTMCVIDDSCDYVPNFEEEEGYILVDSINKARELKLGRKS